MTPERWKQIEGIFHQALDLFEPERRKFVEAVCADDMELLNEVNSLLQQDDKTGSMLKDMISKVASSIPQDDIDHLPGKHIGPYRIEELIGQGGMAQVYKAVRDDSQYQKVVAIKMIRPGFVPSFLINRFWSERQILANLEHPSIARFLEGGTTEGGIPYFVMEYIEGVPITEYCDKKHLTIQNRLKLFRIVCNAVQYAHTNLVVHRDLKPSNILVTEKGVPMLLDFGIAKLLNPDLLSAAPAATITAFRMMTPEYASPEQVRGEPVTTATDIYSLGVLLYELITGKRAHQFKTKSPVEIERVVCEQDPERPSSAVLHNQLNSAGTTGIRTMRKAWSRELGRDLDSIVLMAIQKKPELRYQTAEQLSDDIQRFQRGLPIRARAQTIDYRVLKFIRRHKAAVVLAAITFLLLVTFAAMMTVQASRIAKERDRANQVTEFLVKLFEVSNPGEARGNSVTARELLDSSARKIQKDLKNQPEVQAAMMETIGRVYGNLGLYNTAIPLLEKALELRTRILGDEHPDVASDMNALAEALYNAGKYDDAEPLAKKALGIRRKLLGNKDPAVAESLSNLGGGLIASGKYDEAESTLREALDIRQEVFGMEDVNVATSLTQLALLLKIEGEDDEAERLTRRALSIRRKLLGNDHPAVATSLNNLGRMLYDKGDYDEAAIFLREAVELDRKTLGLNHPDLAISMTGLGRALLKKGKYTEAEKLLRDSLDLRRKALGNEHPSVATGLCNLAILLTQKGDVDEAESLVKEAQTIWKKTLPPDHQSHSFIFVELGQIQMVRKNYKEAEKLYLEALQIRTHGLPADHPTVVSVKKLMGECLTAQHRYEEAEPMLLDCYRIMSAKPGVKHPDTLEAARDLASLYESWGKPDEAQRWKEKSGSPR